jgi:hypothetical protein
MEVHHEEIGTLVGYLLAQYGPLMNMEDLAKVLRRNRKALREAMQSNPEADWVKAILSTRVTVGARDMFRTHEIAEMLQADWRCGN